MSGREGGAELLSCFVCLVGWLVGIYTYEKGRRREKRREKEKEKKKEFSRYLRSRVDERRGEERRVEEGANIR